MMATLQVDPTWQDFISSDILSIVALEVLFSIILFSVGLGLLFLKNWARQISMGTLIILSCFYIITTMWRNYLYLKVIMTLSMIFCFFVSTYLVSPKIKEQFR